MIRMIRNTKKIKSLLWLILVGISMVGCGSVGLAQESSYVSAFQNKEQENQSSVGMYDSADTAIVRTVDTEEQKITLVNVYLNKNYTLDYDGTTLISDKYGNSMSMPQVKAGDIANVRFMKDTKKLTNLDLSSETFIYGSISKYSFDGEKENAVIGNQNYRLKNSTLIFSEGKQIEAADIVSRDIVTVKGIGRTILSVLVEKGHGYLKLKNDAYVIGGWIEVGQSVIQQITNGMLLTVPEGNMEVHITCRGIDVVRKVTIERNKETVLDLSDMEIEEVKTGKVYFTVTPSTADVHVDGEKVNIGKAVEMDYGLHQIMCEAAGYDTITQYIKVSQPIASVTIDLDLTGRDQSSSLPEASVSENSLAAGSYRVYIDSPQNVEVYQDGVYMGISPVNFEKMTGSHTITLRREGYVTKSYTIQLDNEKTDVTYSFPELEKIPDGKDTSNDTKTDGNGKKGVSDNSLNDVSGNHISGNSLN